MILSMPRLPMILSLLLCIATLAGCDISALSGKATESLQIKRVEIKKQGGRQCADNTDSNATANNSVSAEDERCVRIRFAYPEISSSTAPKVADKINQFIMRSLLSGLQGDNGQPAPTIESFAQQFIDDYESDPNTFNSWELELTADVDYSNRDLLSLNVAEAGYTGGAHPFSGARYYVLDLKSGDTVSLTQLLNTEFQTELNVMGEKAFREARALPSGTSLEDEGFWFENNTFQVNDNFGVREEGLVFLFNPYEVAPYAMGPTEYLVPYEDIKHLIDPKGALAAIYSL